MRSTARHFTPTILSLATAYDDQSGPSELIIPETFEGMEYAAVAELYASAVEAFDALYALSADEMSTEQLEQLAELTDGVEALASEIAKRDEEKTERAEAAAALAARVKGVSADADEDSGEQLSADTEDSDEEDEDESGEGSDEDEADDAANVDEGAGETVTASGARRETRIPLSGIKRKAPKPPANDMASGIKSVAFASGDAGTGYAAGEGVDFLDMAKAIDRKLTGYNSGQFAAAAKAGRHLREQYGIASFHRNIPAELTISSSDREHVDQVISRAVDEKRLPQGGLVAAGGWCAPSETLYDLLEIESRDGMLSLPEVGIARGGISFTTGPSFADLYSQFTGFQFTEEDDQEGRYQAGVDGNVEGPKPFHRIECPDFEEVRLEVAGLGIQAGLLMSRGYPEVIARTIRGALVAHDHRLNGVMIQRLADGSTAVTMPNTPGATASILNAVELQATHYRYAHRLPQNATLEAVFPLWLRGAMRADLARREGLEVFEVSDQRLNAWLASRQIAPQFVYNWQAIDGTAAASFTAWPTVVSFLLYAAGTWVRGSTDIITLDTIYDSTLLEQNDYTALFTEEGWLVAKRGFDSRVVTVPMCYDGGVAAAVALECDGTASAPEGGDGG